MFPRFTHCSKCLFPKERESKFNETVHKTKHVNPLYRVWASGRTTVCLGTEDLAPLAVLMSFLVYLPPKCLTFSLRNFPHVTEMYLESPTSLYTSQGD